MGIVEDIQNIRSGKKELKSFAIALGGALFLFGTINFFKSHNFYQYFYGGGILFFLFGFFSPKVLIPLQKTWMGIAILVGFIVSVITVLGIFYLIVTPIGVLGRVFGKRFLETSFDKDSESCWIKRDSQEFTKEVAERQF